MLGSIKKIFVTSTVVAVVNLSFAMEIYTVKPNDYLYKIAKSYSVDGVSNSELVDAIRGINKAEIPGIVDNRIRVGDKLALPTTKSEVEDGLALDRNQILHGSYDNNHSNNQNTVTSLQNLSVVDNSTEQKLGDREIVDTSSSTENTSTSQNTIISSNQQIIPALIPGDTTSTVIYNDNLDSQDIQTTEGFNNEQANGFTFGNIFKLVLSLLILAGLAVIAKKVWENISSKKELELELISKRKRDHLMSRISPVVSGRDFYMTQQTLQNEFDFFSDNTSDNQEEPVIKNTDPYSEANLDILSDDLVEEFGENDNNVAVKTEKGIVFETSVNNKFGINAENSVEEVEPQENVEQELLYVKELVEQYLDSEKYMEASITIQDSLEKDPNNVELRYRLLEVYARAGDEIAFEGEVHFIKSKNIVSMFDPLHQKIAKLRDKYFE
ncbi:LysM peptidoglycan-binding domain-containing protein [Allofrancisella guangzhouensis]|uniref:Peptidoglycan-binding protein n=1 Tax=Allofrancisella guangzhouensis TaxID=594679 RepID=A0A0A8E1Y2_9GAMM|nr:LysM domain-containing protein [Allofrancisella guangzhouensis]AJC48220.1 peptidoglycan-binding protein [Allofrancisella guangzhouensis]MBK2027160.1 LysM peptidoglycan-binding domain-containing protein [Allofrancisella guangzhouensis]MBK2044584.1 LysM peptidoglycan-binding domain-containing protein [Allofrancisella guangzhouensis]MBK2045998.1 LysM peptidoglycan-binding domain-containing protein [Allofrancisella guangzhouensis]